MVSPAGSSPHLVAIPAAHGWVNDPTGMVLVGGRHHLYFQMLPGASAWDYGVGWGHATSSDLVRWRVDSERCLEPDRWFDRDGCFSGSAVVERGRVWVAYTGVVRDARTGEIQERQCLAFSDDGRHFEKLARPVLVKPPGSRMNSWRDPHLFMFGGRWHMLLGTGWQDLNGRVLLYRGDARLPGRRGCWRLRSTLARFPGSVLECPFLARVPTDIWARPSTATSSLGPSPLRLSTAGASSRRECLPAGGGVPHGWVLGASCQKKTPGAPVYWVGGFDGTKFTPLDAAPQQLAAHDGRKLYAATVVYIDGRPHAWAWVDGTRTMYGPCPLRLDATSRRLRPLCRAF
jgi:sucrose-6-phosphate hydrolase SacC (GH32 family)